MRAANIQPRPSEDGIRVLLHEPNLEHWYAVAEAMVTSQDVFDIVHVSSLQEILECLEHRDFDAALIDLACLGTHVEGALLRIVSMSPATSVILICDGSEQDLAMEGVRHGAHDYVVRDLAHTESLVRTVRSSLGRHSSKTNLHFLAHHDALTGLANRVLFARCLEGALCKLAQTGQPIGVLYLDLDGFKPVNDQHGHDSGDELLKIIARRLRINIHRTDVVARMGGDEFAILLENLDTERDASVIAERLVEAVQEPIYLNSAVVQVSCSVGVATALEVSSASELLKAADEAMYRAKRVGGGGVWLYASDPPPPGGSELRTALDRGEFELFYQPQVDLDGQLCGMEALLRWNRDGEQIGPNEFVPQLEETGLIVVIGDWVLRTALLQLITWREEDGLTVPRMAVNVSPVQLHQAGFAERIASLLEELGLSADSLEVEVTERVVLSDEGYLIDNLEHIRKLGVQIALDDFGTGYSSLSNLHRYPIHTLKIDRSFVQDIETNPRSFSIVGSILDLGRRFGIVTVAEGVETEAQAKILRDEGCMILQGFLFGRPRAGAVLPLSDYGVQG